MPRLEEQLRETKASILVCDSLNLEEGLEVVARGGVAAAVVVGVAAGEQGAATRVEELVEGGGERAMPGHSWDWDCAPLLLSYTSRDGRSRVVEHTNRSLTFQVVGKEQQGQEQE